MSFFKDFLSAVAIAAIGVATGGIGTVAAFLRTTAVVLGANTYASHQQRKAARAAKSTAASATVQNNIVLRTADYPECIIYGRTRVPLILAYACMHTVNEGGVDANYATVVLALPCRHEINAIVSVLAGDYDIGPLDSQGYVTTGKYFFTKTSSHSFFAAGSGPSTVYYLEHTAGEMQQSGVVDSVSWVPDPPPEWNYGSARNYAAETLTLGTDYTVSGNAVTVARDTTGGQLVFTYRYVSGYPHLRVIRNLAGSTPHDWLDLTSVSNGELASSDDLTGVPNIVVRMRWDAANTMWAGQMPEWSVIVEGKKLYDPKKDSTKSALGGSGAHRYNDSSTWEYSNRPSLCWRDYMQNEFRCTESEIDDAAVISAEPLCDALVTVSGTGDTEKAFTCDGIISTADEHWVNIERLAVTMMGNAVCTGGQWRIVPFGWTAPVSTLGTDSLAEGEVAIVSRPGIENTTNCVRGKFMDNRATQYSPNGLYVMHDFPSYKSASYINEDLGQEYWDDVEFPLTTGPWRSQRMAKFYMYRARNALTVSAPFNLDAYELQPGDRVRLPWAMNGWEGSYEGGSGKVFQVLSHKYTPPYRVDLTLKEDASAYHNWTYTEAFGVDPSPNSTLPPPNFVATLKNVRVRSDSTTYYVDKSGNVVPYAEISFDKPNQLDVYVVLYWKRASDTEYKPVRGAIGATYLRIEYVGAGETLNAYLIAYNQLGAESDPVWIPTIVIGSDVPAPIIAVSANLLRNTTFDNGVVSGWTVHQWDNDYRPTFQRQPLPEYHMPGSPTSAYISLNDPRTGTAEAVAISNDEFIAVEQDKTYIAFCGLAPYACDGVVAIVWFDSAFQPIPGRNVDSRGVFNADIHPLNTWNKASSYTVADARGKPPVNAMYAKMYVVLGGTFTSYNEKLLSIYKPFFGEIPEGAIGLPPWDPGNANPVNTAQVVPDAFTNVGEYIDLTGFGIAYENQDWDEKQLAAVTAQAAGAVEITVTFECSGSNSYTGAKEFRAGLFQTSKIALIERHALTVPPRVSETQPSSNKNTLTLQATMRVAAGELITPILRFSRTAKGGLSLSPNDRVYNIVTRITVIKR